MELRSVQPVRCELAATAVAQVGDRAWPRSASAIVGTIVERRSTARLFASSGLSLSSQLGGERVLSALLSDDVRTARESMSRAALTRFSRRSGQTTFLTCIYTAPNASSDAACARPLGERAVDRADDRPQRGGHDRRVDADAPDSLVIDVRLDVCGPGAAEAGEIDARRRMSTGVVSGAIASASNGIAV